MSTSETAKCVVFTPYVPSIQSLWGPANFSIYIGQLRSRLTELLDILAYFPNPGDWNILVCPYQAIELVSSLIANDSWVLGKGKTSIWIDVGQERVDIAFERSNYFWVGVKICGLRWEGALRPSDIISCPPEKGKFSTMVVVLVSLARCITIQIEAYIVIRQRCHNPQAMLPCLEDGPIHGGEGLLINYSQSWHQAQGIPNADA